MQTAGRGNRYLRFTNSGMLMTAVYLERITVKFPSTHFEFPDQLAVLIDVLGWSQNHVLELACSDQRFFPKIRVDFQCENSAILTDFTLSNGETTSVIIENSTGLNKHSPHMYQPISVGTVSQRFLASGVRLAGIDHVGSPQVYTPLYWV